MRLEPPIDRYITGKLPSHSTTAKLGEHFVGLDQGTMVRILEVSGAIKNRKPTKSALKLGLLDVCRDSLLWRLESLEKVLKKAGLNPQRAYANQELPDVEPGVMVALSTIASYFNVSSAQVGRWLKELGYRGSDGAPLKKVLKAGHAEKLEYKDGNKKREFYKWDLLWTLEKLQGAGHLFDFDYEKSLKGTGKNSDVTVTTVDDRAREIAEEFVALYNKPETRLKAVRKVNKLHPDMIERIEKLLRKPGWISSGRFREGL